MPVIRLLFMPAAPLRSFETVDVDAIGWRDAVRYLIGSREIVPVAFADDCVLWTRSRAEDASVNRRATVWLERCACVAVGSHSPQQSTIFGDCVLMGGSIDDPKPCVDVSDRYYLMWDPTRPVLDPPAENHVCRHVVCADGSRDTVTIGWDAGLRTFYAIGRHGEKAVLIGRSFNVIPTIENLIGQWCAAADESLLVIDSALRAHFMEMQLSTPLGRK